MSFMVVIGDDIVRTMRVQRMLHAYNSVLHAYMVYSDNMPYISEDIGTVIHIDSKEKIQTIMHTMPSHVRYIGLVNGTDEIIGLPKTVGYIGIPVPPIPYTIPPTMYKVQHPHVTLAPPSDIRKLDQFKSLLGIEVEYQYSSPVKTKTVVANPVLINGEIMHITRGVVHGHTPKRAIMEMEGVKGESYETTVGFPVVM